MAKPFKIGNKFRVRTVVNGQRISEYHSTHDEAVIALKKYELENLQFKKGFKNFPTYNKLTFLDLVERWKKHHLPNKRRPKNDLSILNRYLLGFFKDFQIRDINVLSIENFKLIINHLKPKTQYNILALLRSLLNYAYSHEWLDRVPKIKMPRIQILDSEYAYLKTDWEIESFLIGCKSVNHQLFVLCATAINTGMRQGELAGLKWEDIDFKKQQITIKRSFDGPTKNGKIRYVPILNNLLPILEAWRLQNPLECVFRNEIGNPLSSCQRIFQETFKQALDQAGFKKRNNSKHYIVFHDLRHTFASHWMMKGGDIYKLKNILGHSNITMTQRYAHLAPEVYQEDLDIFNNNKNEGVKYDEQKSKISNLYSG